MIVRGTWDWNLVKIETDAGVYGIGEAYWGFGVKDFILQQLKPLLIGEDPLNVDRLYTHMLMRSAGQGAIGGITVTAASGVEIALVGFGRPSARHAGRAICLGARFRDRIRFYRTLQTVEDAEDMQQWRDQVQAAQRGARWAGRRSSSRETGFPPTPTRTTRNPAMTTTLAT